MKNLENAKELNEFEVGKVAGGAEVDRRVLRYIEPDAAPEEPTEGGAQGTW